MKKLFSWLFKKTPTPIQKSPVTEEKVSLYEIKKQSLLTLIATYSNKSRYDICQYDPRMTVYDWQKLYDYDAQKVEEYKQELALLESQKILGLTN